MYIHVWVRILFQNMCASSSVVKHHALIIILLLYTRTFSIIINVSINHPIPGHIILLVGEVVTSIALDELRVYWTDGSSIYYVNRSLPNNVMIGSNITGVKSLLSLSPGRQPQFGTYVVCAKHKGIHP